MNSIRTFAILAILSLIAIPALGDLTEYQKGVMDGMKAGLIMGKLLGAAPYDPAQTQEYNNKVSSFNQGLAAVFGNNQTILSKFWMQPMGSSAVSAALGNYSDKPIHAIDASWNQTKKMNADVMSQGKYYGYDLDTYIAMTGTVPNNIPNATQGIGTTQNAYGSMGAGP